MNLSFSHIMKQCKRTPAPGLKSSQPTRNVLLRFYPPQSALGNQIFYRFIGYRLFCFFILRMDLTMAIYLTLQRIQIQRRRKFTSSLKMRILLGARSNCMNSIWPNGEYFNILSFYCIFVYFHSQQRNRIKLKRGSRQSYSYISVIHRFNT
jgi:hypothetical protein